MKFLTSVLTCFVIHTALVRCAPFTDESSDPDLNDSIDLCAAEVGLLVEEARRSFTMPIEAPGNCVVACVWKKIGLMELDGKIIKEEMISTLHPTLKQMPDITPIREDNFYHCVDDANDYEGGCIVVSEYFKCIVRDLFNQLSE